MHVKVRARAVAAVLLWGVAFLGGGCEEDAAPPPEVMERLAAQDRQRVEAEQAPAGPTTQELLTGPRKQIPLGTLPLTARVPESWSVQALGGGNVLLLQGPAPSGAVQIQLAHRPPIKAEQFDAMIAAAREEMTENPQAIKAVDIRPLPGSANGKVLERQTLGRSIPPDLTDDDPANDAPENLLGWTITAYIPEGPSMLAYELNFLGLTQEQYEADRALLREVIDSVAPAGAAGPGPTTAPAPAPTVG